ncbi:MAG: YfiR family protein [Gemmatimonadetes bacterium]|nr:YfiR family protein [Gemmatimonadota bacterium]
MLVVLGVLAAACPSRARAEQASAAEVKATCVYKVTKFVHWAPETSDETFVVGYFGSNPLDGALEAVFADREVVRRPVILRQLHSLEELDEVHIAVVTEDLGGDLCAFVSRAREQSVLTFGDSPGFAQDGGMVEMSVENRRLKIKINWAECERAGISVSSQLLVLAEQVDDDGCR